MARPYEVSVPFRAGAGGYASHRIPAVVVTRAGTLLAFAEGRVGSSADHGDIDLVLKRSADGGRTWGEPQVVARNGNGTAGNPAPVVLEDGPHAGRVVLVHVRSAANRQEQSLPPIASAAAM